MTTKTSPEDLIIIGSGPAGYTAAIYAARANLNPLVFEGAVDAGGALMNTTDVENFPGFADGVQGPILMDSMRAQAERFGARFIAEDVGAVKLTETLKGVRTVDGDTFTSRAIVLATGSAYKQLGVPREEELVGKGVSYCATCDGFFFQNQNITVIGGGDSAAEEAIFLTKFTDKVTMLVRRDKLKASKIMQSRVLNHPNIEIIWNSAVHSLQGDRKLENLVIENTIDGSHFDLPTDGLFIAIGHSPRSELFSQFITIDELGYAVADGVHGSTSTLVPGVFVAGDLVDHTYRQAITAAASGAQAAIDAERWLETHSHA